MELILVRHGEPAWSADGLSVDDPPLTDLGHEQAAITAKSLAHVEVDEILVSPLVRAQQTAAPIAETLGIAPTTLPWLREIFPGNWGGTPQEAVEQAFRETRDRPLDEQWDGIPGGESFRHFHERVTSGLSGLLRDQGSERLSAHPPLWRLARPDRRVMVVAHGGTNAVALGYLLGIEPVPWEWERFVTFHASTSTVQPIAISGGHSFSLTGLSNTLHLPEQMRTR
jgi:probable phosphoglycerate mutase